MEKRLILAIALSLLVLLSWSALAPKTYHIENKEVIKEAPAVTSSPQIFRPEKTLSSEIPPTSLLKWSNDKYEIAFIEPYAAIKEVEFKTFFSSKLNLEQGFYIADPSLIFTKESLSSQELTFVCNSTDKKIVKHFYYDNSNYSIELEIKIQNLSNAVLKLDVPLVLGVLNFSGDQNEVRFQDVTVATEEKVIHLNARKESVFNAIKFLGLRNRYFCAIIEPLEKNIYTAFIKTDTPRQTIIGLKSKAFILSPGQQIEQKFRIYLGPQDLKVITSIKPDWSVVMHYGTFGFISQLLLQLLEILHRLVRNWGFAIVILSIMIYFLLYPLTLKQMRAMKEMQSLQPRIEELRKIYKDNPQKLNKEIMELYRVHKVNPLGGCLPLVLQIPIFFALYQALMRSVALKGARFLWIKDLSRPDSLFILPVSLPMLGNEINLLPILMSIGMFVQQKLSMKTTSSASSEQQKLMLIIFPLMFGFIFYRMPSGLVLYWLVNSLLMLTYQFQISRPKQP